MTGPHEDRWRGEWPTWLVIVAVYGIWIGTLVLYRRGTLGLPAATVLLVVDVAWFMSLQHELLHGHPTRWPAVNKLLGYAPLAVWYPYALYRDTHLQHHDDERLTLPGTDPESTYVAQAAWARAGALRRGARRLAKTFLGRLVLGPPLGVATMAAGEVRMVLRGDLRRVPMWFTHGSLCAALMWAVQAETGVAAWYYLVAISYPALSLASVRSFYEHRAVPDVASRTVINEGGVLTRLLFLNNNLHAVHHARPGLPWYALPGAYRRDRDAFLRANGGFVAEDGYWGLLLRHALRPVDGPVHPWAREEGTP